METISEFINSEKITDRQFDTNVWYKKPRIVCHSECRSGLERLVDNVRVTHRCVKRHGDCPPGKRARDRSDKMKETILMVTIIQSVAHSGIRALQK